MPIYDCGDPDCFTCKWAFRQPKPDPIAEFNAAAEKAKRAIERAQAILAETMRQVERERERRLAATEARGRA